MTNLPLTLLRLSCLAISAMPAVFAVAAGGPPYNTDDPEPVDWHHWEVYVASIYSHTPGLVSGTLPHFEVNYGAAPNLQLHIIAPLAFSDPAGGSATYGYGDTELGAKFRFVQEGKRMPMVGIFPLVELPTGNVSRGLGAGQARFFLPVWLQKTVGNWQTYGGGGYWINPGAGNRNYWFVGYQLQNQVTRQLSIGGELFHVTATAVGGEQETGFNVGAVYDVDDGHHLMLSLGRDVQGTTGLAAYAAFQWTFGPKGK
ncbi:MAG: hypothetical protein ACYC96_14485 [Fimbriimonadaceae bacterium]